MSNKIQGEGDYKSARRFNKEEQEFVRRKIGKRQKAEADFDSRRDAELGDDEDTEIAEHIDVSRLRRVDGDPQV
jgi:hypothetical protein